MSFVHVWTCCQHGWKSAVPWMCLLGVFAVVGGVGFAVWAHHDLLQL